MVAVAVVAVLFALPGGWGVMGALLLFPFACLFAGQWLVDRGLRRAAASGFCAVALLANFAFAAFCVAPDSYVLLAVSLSWPFIVLPACAGLGVPWAILSSRGTPPRRQASPAPGILVFGMTVLPLLTLATFWPLYLAFLDARPTLERLADQVASGKVVSFPQRAGLFQVVGARVDPGSGNVALIIDPEPSGPNGLVRARSGTPADMTTPIVGSNLNLYLGSGWWYRDED